MSIAATLIAGFTHNTAAENDNTKYAAKLEACFGPSCATSVDLFGAREPDNHLLMTAAQLLIQHNWSSTRNARTEFTSQLESGS